MSQDVGSNFGSYLCFECSRMMLDCAIGTCAACGAGTSSGAYKLCCACARGDDVCQACLKEIDHTKENVIADFEKEFVEKIKKEAGIINVQFTERYYLVYNAKIDVENKKWQEEKKELKKKGLSSKEISDEYRNRLNDGRVAKFTTLLEDANKELTAAGKDPDELVLCVNVVNALPQNITFPNNYKGYDVAVVVVKGV